MSDEYSSDDDRAAAILKTIGTGHSVKSEVHTDNSVNKHLPYIWFNGVMAAAALSASICSIIIIWILTARAAVSENHWRDLERDFGILKHQVEQEKDHDRR